MKSRNELKWKTLASEELKFTGYGSVNVTYSLSPGRKKILSFFQNTYGRKTEKRFVSFEADEDTIQKLLQFLHGKVQNEFEVKDKWVSNWLYDYSNNLKKMAVSSLITNILGEEGSRLIHNEYTDNEVLVVKTFEKMHSLFGFETIVNIGTKFPDAICVKDGKETRCEFEYRSSNFKYHGHDSKKCDYIICWIHDWTDCPLKVIPIYSLLLDMVDVSFSLNGMPIDDIVQNLIRNLQEETK